MKAMMRTTCMSACIGLFIGAGMGTAMAAVPASGEETTSFIPQGPDSGTELFPPNARPGGCYARVLEPAQYQTEKIRMLKSEASEKLVSIPAKFETVEQTIVVKEASEKLVIVPATYEWVEEKVMVKPAFDKIEPVPAQYEMVSEKVIDKPAHVVWEKGRGLIEKVDFGTGEIVCLKEIPATYKTVTKRVQKSPPTTRTVTIPAQYKLVKRRVMKTPPTTKTIVIPEEKKVAKVLKMIAPATMKRIAIPEEWQVFTKRIKVAEEKMAWKPVLCENNTTPRIVQQLQQSLRDKGFNPGPIDGKIGDATTRAVLAYQKDQGLPIGGLTMETFKALKVDLPWVSESMAINTGSGKLQ